MTWSHTLRSLRQLDSLDLRRGRSGPDVVLRARRAEGPRLGRGVFRNARRHPPGEPGVRHARHVRRRRRGARVDLRNASHRVDHHRVDISLQRRGRDRPVPGHERLDRRPVGRQTAAADFDRVLFRGISRGHGRRRRARGDRGRVSDRPGLQSFPGRRALPRGQHRTGRVGRHRQSHSYAGRCDRTPRNAVQRDDGAHPAAALVDPAPLAGPQYGRLEGNAGSVAGAPGERPLVRAHAVLLVELSGSRPGRYRVGHLFVARHGRLPEVLAPGHHHAGQ